MRALALGLLLAVSAGAQPRAAAPDPAGVAAILQADPELRANHEGYLAFLARHPAIAKAERDLTALMRLPGVYPELVRFDEALHADPGAEARFDRHYDRLARDPGIRRAVESAYRLEFQARGNRRLAEPLAWFRANPDTALRFLRRPESVRPVPEAVYNALNDLRDRPQLLSELGDAFEALLAQPGGRTDVLPWWSDVAAPPPMPFQDQPHRFWVWHQRHLAFAEDAHARTWARWWLRKTRRVAGLGYAYTHYLGTLDEGHAPDPDAAWPPPQAPPDLPKIQPEDAPSPAPRGGVVRPPRPERPPRPAVTRPEVPRPNRPALPDRPVKPDKPEPRGPSRPK